MRILQSAGLVAISYELIHDTPIIPIDASPQRDADVELGGAPRDL
jgi:hypothetical protein